MAEGYQKDTELFIFKYNEISQISFELKESLYLKNKDSLQQNNCRHATVKLKKQKKVIELQKLVVSMRDIMKIEKEEATLQAIQMHQNSKEMTKTLK